ncbi:cytochrome c oxidase assembly protein [Methylicorpusculum oleiharenae]|uniref:cytochrome c oxidase assembly protein n=1 Tax=Methylicorpusculum oleiharenae TaxID=1338687 RepID=UPI00135A2ABC|nr:cytochrome c oxidase assembly protein [Methylicorpusculum oleiharenae]MCD2451764.1 cytochrome c oxidase assembly protein [Methylicorpusculum oleiharenae]
MSEGVDSKNRKLVTKLALIAIAMFGFGYALVPIYDVFCDITGLNGKTNTDAVLETQYQVDKSREIKVEFVTSVNKSAPMTFRAESNKIVVHPGQFYTVNFYAENLTDKKMLAQAIPSVSPGLASEYFKKTECFCFTEQVFDPGEGKTMPVRFVVEPGLPEQYKTITLSYTFFDNTDKSVKN